MFALDSVLTPRVSPTTLQLTSQDRLAMVVVGGGKSAHDTSKYNNLHRTIVFCDSNWCIHRKSNSSLGVYRGIYKLLDYVTLIQWITSVCDDANFIPHILFVVQCLSLQCTIVQW